MADLSGTQRVLPRRPPAHKSVSLRHTKSPSASARPASQTHSSVRGRVPSSNLANPPSSNDSSSKHSTDSKPETRKESSGESSNADKWFERSNNDVQVNASNIADAEPPFYLKNSSSSETPPDAPGNGQHGLPGVPPSAVPYHHNLIPIETQGSSSEDFRSVIDDLTVENKKLKRRLKKYEKLYDAHLQQEKLFEIRVHGLPPNKKRELEETLRRFAMSMEQSPPSTSLTSGYATSTPMLDQQPTASSHTSTRFADSAYVSATASGQHSLAPSAAEHKSRKTSKHAASRSKDMRNRDIHTYLHDIPNALLPKHPVAMTEKAKRKLVVRRLEQIFAGKGAAVGGHQQPLQQQEVSQLAAHADRMAIEASGQQARAEGLREARIMPDEEKPALPSRHVDHITKSDKLYAKGKNSPEQRPTRPLDLDLHRAQVPQDNIDYFRHLGFSPTDFDAAESDDHGWIYINVLSNMAQLHTLNVTAEFVRKAIADASDKLQLSRDGRKARWRGGHEVTRASSDGSPAEFANSPNGRLQGKFGLQKKSLAGRASSGTSSVSAAKASRVGSVNKLAYVPLFFHKQDSDAEDLTSDEQDSSWEESHHNERLAGNSSGLTSSGIRTSSSKPKRGEDGPIIFYSKAKFCTDLSGDRNEHPLVSRPSSVKYEPVVSDPVGVARLVNPNDDIHFEERGPLGKSIPPVDVMDVDSASAPDSEQSLHFSPKNTTTPAKKSGSSPTPLNFEVSGLGGVQPSDHFRIDVQSRRKSIAVQSLPNATHYARNRVYPQRIQQILGKRSRRSSGTEGSTDSPVIEEELVSTSHEHLPASTLPEPATFFAFSSYGDESDGHADDSGAESDVSSFADDADRPPPSTAPQAMQLSSHSSDEEESEEDDESSDSSVDFLAAAREVDPRTVREREREYDANMAERLAEEIPAGSSAATAGGGSGFNTPVSPEVAADGSRRSASAKHGSVAGRASVSAKRQRTAAAATAPRSPVVKTKTKETSSKMDTQ